MPIYNCWLLSLYLTLITFFYWKKFVKLRNNKINQNFYTNLSGYTLGTGGPNLKVGFKEINFVEELTKREFWTTLVKKSEMTGFCGSELEWGRTKWRRPVDLWQFLACRSSRLVTLSSAPGKFSQDWTKNSLPCLWVLWLSYPLLTKATQVTLVTSSSIRKWRLLMSCVSTYCAIEYLCVGSAWDLRFDGGENFKLMPYSVTDSQHLFKETCCLYLQM